MNNCGIVILAAGASTRLGQPKQLLEFEGKSLISRLTEAARAVAGDQVIVVTGKYQLEVESEVASGSVVFIHNENWEQGMGSSIAAGIAGLQMHFPDTTHVILAVSDQPFVTSEIFESLLSLAGKDKILASQYADTLGTPVLFPVKYFSNLLSLKGIEGAKKLLHQFKNEVVAFSFPLGKIDIDTPSDYQNLLDK